MNPSRSPEGRSFDPTASSATTSGATVPVLSVSRRFCGPPTSGNGGYVCGRLAEAVPTHGAVEVTLRMPPPLETPMSLERDGDRARLTFGGGLIAEAEAADLDVDLVELVPFSEAADAAPRYGGLVEHPFPTCFVCGPERAPGDGMRLFPGRLPDRPDTVAAAWVPDDSLSHPGEDEVPEEIVWAALDCPGGWSLDLAGRPMVLGRMTAQVDALPLVGDQCVVMGRLLGQEGRKAFTMSTAYDGDGRVLGRAHAVWIAVDRSRL